MKKTCTSVSIYWYLTNSVCTHCVACEQIVFQPPKKHFSGSDHTKVMCTNNYFLAKYISTIILNILQKTNQDTLIEQSNILDVKGRGTWPLS